MTTFNFSSDEISSLKRTHRTTKKKREADRIKVIILLVTGWTIRQSDNLFNPDMSIIKGENHRIIVTVGLLKLQMEIFQKE